LASKNLTFIIFHYAGIFYQSITPFTWFTFLFTLILVLAAVLNCLFWSIFIMRLIFSNYTDGTISITSKRIAYKAAQAITICCIKGLTESIYLNTFKKLNWIIISTITLLASSIQRYLTIWIFFLLNHASHFLLN
jgi:hypothetical protein